MDNGGSQCPNTRWCGLYDSRQLLRALFPLRIGCRLEGPQAKDPVVHRNVAGLRDQRLSNRQALRVTAPYESSFEATVRRIRPSARMFVCNRYTVWASSFPFAWGLILKAETLADQQRF